jgi:ribosomal protein S14
MKHSNYKDFNKRSFIEKGELILLQEKISKRISKKFLESYKSKSYIFRTKNRCVLTARSKGICSDFKLSRIKTRELGLNGLVNGLKKVSW